MRVCSEEGANGPHDGAQVTAKGAVKADVSGARDTLEQLKAKLLVCSPQMGSLLTRGFPE